MAFIKRFWKKRGEKGGLATVEAALVMLLLIVVTFGAMEYGWIFFRMQQVSNVAREAARTAALAGRTNADVTNRVNTLLGQWGLDAGSATVTIYPSTFTTGNPGDPVTVTISVPYADNGLLANDDDFHLLIGVPENLTSTATMANER
jgi:Flp pilus assembly protein TadG